MSFISFFKSCSQHDLEAAPEQSHLELLFAMTCDPAEI